MDRNKLVRGAIESLNGKVSQIRRRINDKRLYDLFYFSSKDELTSLYSLIKSYNYFDNDWYRLAYSDEIEFPDDLLLDYVKAGILHDRNPSPYFNSILYRREHSVAPERALLHYLRSGRAVDAGAYRNEEALLAAQRTFQAHTETTLTKENRASTRSFAVFLQCGAESLWRYWQPAKDQSWHMLVNHYDATYAGKIPCDVEFQQTGAIPGTKFTALHSLLEQYPHTLAPYEYILLLDDDVQFDDGAIDHLFSTIQNHGWEMAQASLSPESSCSFPVFFNPSAGGWREVNGVELMMPVYSARILGLVKQLIGQSVSGWGYDTALSLQAARQEFHAAVVDDVIAYHRRSINADIGKYYQMLHHAQIYPEIEFTHLQKKFGFTKPLFYQVSSSSAAAGMQL